MASITLYADGKFKGDSKSFTTEVSHLSEHDFNDRASSCKVQGSWILYSDANFEGDTTVLHTGDYNSSDLFGDIGNDSLSSIRPVPTTGICLFQDSKYRGSMVHLTENNPRLSTRNFNDAASSAIVRSGTWILYSDMNYEGVVGVLGRGWYPHSTFFGDVGNDALSSVQQLPTSGICLFQNANFRGKMLHLDGSADHLSVHSFNDSVSSVIVISGDWDLFQDAEYGGDSWRLVPGTYSTSTGNFKGDSVSSVRRAPSLSVKTRNPVSAGLNGTAIFDIDWLTGGNPVILQAAAWNGSQTREVDLDAGTSAFNWVAAFDTAVRGFHIQGIALHGDYAYLVVSGPSAGRMIISNLRTGDSRWEFIHKDWEQGHPSNVQVTGDYMVVSLEGDYGTAEAELGFDRVKKSSLLVYDLAADPFNPKLVSEVSQGGVNSGGAGLAYHAGKDRWFILAESDYGVKGWANHLHIYESDSGVIDSRTSWKRLNWQEVSLGTGSGTCLLSASDKSVWAMYFDLDEGEERREYIKLYKVLDGDGSPSAELAPVKQVIREYATPTKAFLLAGDTAPSFRFGGGVSVVNGVAYVLLAERNVVTDFNFTKIPLTFDT